MVQRQGNFTIKQEREYIRERMTQPLLESQIWQVISADWFATWKAYVEFDSPSIGNLSDEVMNRCNLIFSSEFHP